MGDAAQDDALRARLFSYSIGPYDAELSFAQRLSRENRWSAEFAERVIQEYYRFCFLAVTGGKEVTPSDAVDQAWHLHLTYTRDYWERFCPEVLGMPLHHGPTAGTSADRTRYYEQYADTLKAYEEAFGEPPPEDIWASAARRFNVDPLSFRVNPRDVVTIPRRLVGPLLLVVLLLSAAVVFLAGRELF